MKTIILFLFHICLWSQATKWTTEEKEDFVKGCFKSAKKKMQEEQAVTYCNCMLEKVIETYPTPKDVNNLTPEEAKKMAFQCLDR